MSSKPILGNPRASVQYSVETYALGYRECLNLTYAYFNPKIKTGNTKQHESLPL